MTDGMEKDLPVIEAKLKVRFPLCRVTVYDRNHPVRSNTCDASVFFPSVGDQAYVMQNLDTGKVYSGVSEHVELDDFKPTGYDVGEADGYEGPEQIVRMIEAAAEAMYKKNDDFEILCDDSLEEWNQSRSPLLPDPRPQLKKEIQNPVAAVQ